MTFIEALRKSHWIRRRSWPGWIVIKDEVKPVRPLFREDLLANDWVAYEIDTVEAVTVPKDKEPEDDAEFRFSLMELD